jgi:hypothetical protein
MDTPIYYIFLFMHLISLVIGFGSVIVIDAFGFFWMIKGLGVDLTLMRRVAHVTQRLIWLGFIGLIISGIPMLVLKGTLSDLTKLKLFLVIMIGLNGVFLHFIKKRLDELGANIEKVPGKLFFRIGLASVISQFGWWSATFIGFYNRQVKRPPEWSEYYLLIIGIIIFLIGTISTVGETATDKNEIDPNTPGPV